MHLSVSKYSWSIKCDPDFCSRLTHIKSEDAILKIVEVVDGIGKDRGGVGG